jgi:hypothetical protein
MLPGTYVEGIDVSGLALADASRGWCSRSSTSGSTGP